MHLVIILNWYLIELVGFGYSSIPYQKTAVMCLSDLTIVSIKKGFLEYGGLKGLDMIKIFDDTTQFVACII